LSAPELHLVVPGPLDQLTGGYIYDARMVDGLRALGWTVPVHSLEGSFPAGDAVAEASLARALADLPAGARVLIDGLAMGSLPRPVHAHSTRLRILGMVHHPLADETGTSPAEQERLFALEREALSACAGVVVNSAFTAARLQDFGVPSARVRIAPPGIDRGPRVVGPLPGDPPVLLCVGTLTPRKGQDVLMRALALIERLPWTCVCAGSLTRDDDFVCDVEELVEDGGLEERVRFVGELRGAALEALYQHASLFVLPSQYEGYGMAFAEALVRGLPVVGTTGGAVPYTVPADAGVLVPPGDHGALADALAALLTGEEGARTRDRLSEAAWAHGLTLPDWERAAGVFASAVLELTPG
jgi:glycosyltransferase involved in cell wall biosynthesis